jgi:hypothetical protein
MKRPDPSEYAPYFEKYIALVPEGEIVATLSRQADDTLKFLSRLNEAQGELRYAPDKWSVKEVVGHLIDTERIFAYRALRFARGDRTPLAGFDENNYVANAGYSERSLSSLLDEFESVRESSLSLFNYLGDAAWSRRGIANENEISVRALAWIIAGHELHHREIIRSRYL